MARTFEYTERPCGVILGRRGLIKVIGVCAVAAGATGWGVSELLANRNCILLARSDLAASPMDDKMYGLLHTHFSPRSMLALHH